MLVRMLNRNVGQRKIPDSYHYAHGHIMDPVICVISNHSCKSLFSTTTSNKIPHCTSVFNYSAQNYMHHMITSNYINVCLIHHHKQVKTVVLRGLFPLIHPHLTSITCTHTICINWLNAQGLTGDVFRDLRASTSHRWEHLV